MKRQFQIVADSLRAETCSKMKHEFGVALIWGRGLYSIMHPLKSTRLRCPNTTHQVKICYYRGYHYLSRFCWHHFMNVSLFSPSCHLYIAGSSTMTHTHITSTTVKSPGYPMRTVKFVPRKKIRTKTCDTWVSKGIVRHNSNRKILFNPFLITQIYTCHKQTGFYTQLCQVMEKLVCHSTILPA